MMAERNRALRAVVFDLDGTLLDSRRDLAAAANAARAAAALEPLPEDEVERHVGHGLGHLLAHTLPPSLHGEMQRWREAFIAHYRAHLLDHTRPYPSVINGLSALGATPLGLVTNKPAQFLSPILAGFGWSDRFSVVVAGDSLPERKPDPAPLRFALDRLGVAAEAAIYVGDSEVDLATARAADVRFAAVAWGRVAPAAAEAGLDVLDSLSDLRALVSGGAR